MNDYLPAQLWRILNGTPEPKRSFLVGGCVRDWLLGLAPKDFDIEVYGVGYGPLASALSRWGTVDDIGRTFGVIRLTVENGLQLDFSVPRLECKQGPGHGGFDIHFDPTLTPEVATLRRDFTLNALLFDPRRRELLDFVGGEADLRARRLKHVGEAFVEDPLRVLRGFQFAARFGLEPASDTLSLCRSVQAEFSELPVDRVRQEWLKWAEQSTVPSCGLRFLVAAGWIGHFPEIEALIDVPQDPIWHPEGDVFTHTCHCCDALVQLPGWQSADPETRSVLLLTILAHDFAKPQTTHEAIRDGRVRIVAPGHEKAGGPLAERFLQRLGVSKEIQARVIPLVTHHLAHNQPSTDRAVRRLARRLAPESIENLCLIMTADQFGRPPNPRVLPPGLVELQNKAAELKVETKSPTPILRGQHLIEIGLEPGISFKGILDRAFERQLDGEFEDLSAAFRWLSQQTEVSLSDAGRQAAQVRHLEILPVRAGPEFCNRS